MIDRLRAPQSLPNGSCSSDNIGGIMLSTIEDHFDSSPFLGLNLATKMNLQWRHIMPAKKKQGLKRAINKTISSLVLKCLTMAQKATDILKNVSNVSFFPFSNASKANQVYFYRAHFIHNDNSKELK